ncbi:Peroxidase [Parasponia andersonii]|uniref:Peroxidase n=1 Tax=Parasponia andersonii TaxID=3476 RepID=A0A2P5B7W9_PARAD|nr:Peroxidase [Parasponia andersonii]
MKRVHVVLVVIPLSLLLLPSAFSGTSDHHMRVGFYSDKCVQVEFIVANMVARAFFEDPGVAAGLIRLFFHDCFVKGCDASILLDSTPSGEPVEKDSPANGKSLRGLQLIDDIKAQIEGQCPETVSCADIMAFAAREAIFLSGLPYHPVRAGRRDSRTSRAADVYGNLPIPMMSVEDLTKLFESKGLTVEDLVVLSGAHSIGKVHCIMFNYRLNLSSDDPYNPPMEPSYAAYLRKLCNRLNLKTDEEKEKVVVQFDPVSSFRLDTGYYSNLLKGRGLLQSDQALATDPQTSRIVSKMAVSPTSWSWKFVNAMIRLGDLNVLTGNEGHIRKNCRGTK